MSEFNVAANQRANESGDQGDVIAEDLLDSVAFSNLDGGLRSVDATS
jgi:hypothetical protein